MTYYPLLAVRTDFSLGEVTLSGPTMKRGGKVEASVTVTNTGERAGETVVQLYIQDLAASVVRPVKELKDFQKVMLQPGEKKTIRFDVTEDKLKFYNAKLEYGAELGQFNVQVGLDSRDVKDATFELK